MANSSDWLAALAEPDIAPAHETLAGAPDWLAVMAADDRGAGAAFRDVLPFGDPPPPPPPPPPPEPVPVSAPIDPLTEARARGYAEGEAAGRAAAATEGAEQAARQRALRLAFRALDEVAMAVLADDLAATVQALCDAVLGEAATDRDALIARCHVAARRIGGAPDMLALQLHPDDVATLDAEALAGWRIVADAGLERGSVLIEGPEGSVCDGPAEWRRAIAAAVQG